MRSVAQLKNEQGQVQYDHKQISVIFVNYYQNLLGNVGEPRKRANNKIFKKEHILNETQHVIY